MPFDLDPQKTRDAFRLGLQSAVAAALCFIIFGMIGSDEEFVGVLSAVLIVQPSIGRTVSAGWERLLATLVGSAVGLLCLFLLPNGYGVAIALAIVMFVMNFISGFRANWRYGVVAAVALALADTTGNYDIAKARAIAIGIGILIGIGVSLIVWPESSAKRGFRHRKAALNAAAERFGWAMKDEADSDEEDGARRRFHTALSDGREVTRAAKAGDTERLNNTFDAIEELYNSIIVIDRVESPLGTFDAATIERSDLIDAGQAAIKALYADDDDGQAAKEFAKVVDAAEDGLSEHDMSEDGTAAAASVVFALREMERCMENFRNRNEAENKGRLDALKPDALKEKFGDT